MKTNFLFAVLVMFGSVTSYATTYTKYACSDKAGKLVAEFGVQPDCSALPLGCAYVKYGKNRTAIGSYKIQKTQVGSCPSRLCGAYRLQLQVKARSTGPTAQWPVDFVSIAIADDGDGLKNMFGEIDFYMLGGRAPMHFNVDCAQVP